VCKSDQVIIGGENDDIPTVPYVTCTYDIIRRLHHVSRYYHMPGESCEVVTAQAARVRIVNIILFNSTVGRYAD
jgi:hypothetical protein